MILVMSPHMDDAVLSMGEHILKWKKQGKEIEVITVFTKFEDKKVPDYSIEYISKSGCANIKEFEEKRIKEDIEAMKSMGVDYEHWGLVDAGFRGNYETRKELLSGRIDKVDMKIVWQLANKIKKIRAEEIFLPFGVGGHVDHWIVRRAGELGGKKIGYYLESPYLWQGFNWLKYLNKIFLAKSRLRANEKKDEILRCYRSQYKLLTHQKKSFVEVLV